MIPIAIQSLVDSNQNFVMMVVFSLQTRPSLAKARSKTEQEAIILPLNNANTIQLHSVSWFLVTNGFASKNKRPLVYDESSIKLSP
jgi:hypothetical protein